jgi:hypothetical protein
MKSTRPDAVSCALSEAEILVMVDPFAFVSSLAPVSLLEVSCPLIS